MGADKVIFSIRYAENNETKEWDRKKFEIANYIAGLYFNWSPEFSFINALRLGQKHEKAEDFLDGGMFHSNFCFSENDEKRFCEITDNDFSGGIDLVCGNIKKWLNKFYPEIDWELHYYERYGEVFDQITISVDGQQYSGEYEVHLSPDEDLREVEYEEWETDECEGDPPPKTVDEWFETIDFTVPQPTPENPYPIPEKILADYDDADKVHYWACERFQGKTVMNSQQRWYATDLPDQKQSREETEEKAKNGEPSAQLDLAIQFITGDGTDPDLEAGIEWLRKASANGEKNATKLLSYYDDPDRCYQEAVAEMRKNEKADKEKVFKLIDKAAKAGNKSAESDRCVFYTIGYGTEWNYDKGIELLRDAANHGNEIAKRNLAKYQTPDGMCKSATYKIAQNINNGQTDFEDAISLMREAAEHGSVIANANLGMLFAWRENRPLLGMERDIEKAKAYYRKAFELGDKLSGEILEALEEREKAAGIVAQSKPINIKLRIPVLK